MRQLAPRQAEALTYQARGFSYMETAAAMACSKANIANLLRECFFKLHAANTREAIARAMQLGLIHLCLLLALASIFSNYGNPITRPRSPRQPVRPPATARITRSGRNCEDIA